MYLNTLLGLLILIKNLGEYIVNYINKFSIYLEYKAYMYVYIVGLYKYVCNYLFKLTFFLPFFLIKILFF